MIRFIVQIFCTLDFWIEALSQIAANKIPTSPQTNLKALSVWQDFLNAWKPLLLSYTYVYGCYPTVSFPSVHNLINLFNLYCRWRNFTFWPKTELSTLSYWISLQFLTIVDMCTCMYQWLSPLYFHYFILILTKIIGAGTLAYSIVSVMSQTGYQFDHQSLELSSVKYVGVVENIKTTVECF